MEGEKKEREREIRGEEERKERDWGGGGREGGRRERGA